MPGARARKGGGTVYPLPDGRWRAQVDLGIVNGRRVRPTRTVATQKAAREALRELRERAQLATEGPRTTTVDDWLTYWLDNIASERVRPNTLDIYRTYVRLYWTPAIGYVRLEKLSAPHLEAVYKGMREKGLSEATIHQAHAIMRRALKVAEQRGRIRRNVAADIELRQVKANPHEVHNREEVVKILNSARTPREAARLHVALSCGLRQGEALGLDWNEVYETAEVPHLRVVQAATHAKGKGRMLGEPKTASARRTVVLTPAAATMLAAWRAESGGVGLVFPGRQGGIMDPKADWKAWCEAEERAGVRHAPLHGARGSVVSTMHDAGVAIEVAAKVLGHANVSTTQKHYLHITDDRTIEAMRALGQAQEG